jgi:hypothetical protein
MNMMWSLTLRQEHKLQVLENKVLRNMFGCKRDEVSEHFRMLHNKELVDLYGLMKSRRV